MTRQEIEASCERHGFEVRWGGTASNPIARVFSNRGLMSARYWLGTGRCKAGVTAWTGYCWDHLVKALGGTVETAAASRAPAPPPKEERNG